MNKLILATACVLALALTVSGAVVLPSSSCGANEIFTSCGSACPEHCPIRNAKTGQLENGLHMACIDMCVRGCFCAHGFVRDTKRANACVERAICSAP